MDTIILSFFNRTLAHPWLDWLMLSLTLGALGAFVSAGVVLLFKGEYCPGAAVLLSLGVGLLLTLAFQYLVLRPRPMNVRLIWPTPNFPSYPSGHAVAAFASAMVLGLTYKSWVWRLIIFVGAGLVALSRVYLGHHYPSDLLAGVVLGLAVGAACYGLIVQRDEDGMGWRWLLWPQLALVVLISHMAYLGILPLHLLDWPMSDKTMHFLLFGAVVFWLNLWFRGRRIYIGWRSVPLAILIPITIATLEEGLQFFSPLRSASVLDLSSDLAGMFVFWWFSEKFYAEFTRRGR